MGDWSSGKGPGGGCEVKSAIVVRVEVACGGCDACTCRANGVRKYRESGIKLG